MKRLLLIFLPVLIMALQSSSCNKQDPEPNPEPQEPTLPPLTHTGENTFGCKVNGEIWVAEVDPSWWTSDVSASYNSNSNRFAIQGRHEFDDETIEKVTIIDTLEGEGVHAIEAYIDSFEGYQHLGTSNCEYYYDMNNPGLLEITYFDTVKQIISGKFEMDLINPDCAQDTIMHITEGRFDVRY